MLGWFLVLDGLDVHPISLNRIYSHIYEGLKSKVLFSRYAFCECFGRRSGVRDSSKLLNVKMFQTFLESLLKHFAFIPKNQQRKVFLHDEYKLLV